MTDEGLTELEARRLIEAERMSRWPEHTWPIGDIARTVAGQPASLVTAILDRYDDRPPTPLEVDIAITKATRPDRVTMFQRLARNPIDKALGRSA